MEMTYLEYKLKMDSHGIQFSDDKDRITMATLTERHGFEEGDMFRFSTDSEGKLMLQKVKMPTIADILQ